MAEMTAEEKRLILAQEALDGGEISNREDLDAGNESRVREAAAVAHDLAQAGDTPSPAALTAAQRGDLPRNESPPVAIQVAPPAPQPEVMPFEPEHMGHLWRLAGQLSKSSIVPRALQGETANTFVILATGRELGLKPMQSVAALHVIEGKVGMSAQLMVALVQRSGLAEYFYCIDSSDESATFETRRRGAPEPSRIQFTIEQAKQYGLLDRRGSNYRSKPAVMLRWRAASQLARDVYPDIVLGFYTDDELGDMAGDASARAHKPRAVVGVDALKARLSERPSNAVGQGPQPQDPDHNPDDPG